MKQVVYEQGNLIFVSKGEFETTSMGSNLFGSGFEIRNVGPTVLLAEWKLDWKAGVGTVLSTRKRVTIRSGRHTVILASEELKSLWELALVDSVRAEHAPGSVEAFQLTIQVVTAHGHLQIGPLTCLTTRLKQGEWAVAYVQSPATEAAAD